MGSEDLYKPDYTISGNRISEKIKNRLEETGNDTQAAESILNSAVESKHFTTEQSGLIDEAFKSDKTTDRLREIGELQAQDEIRKQMDEIYRKAHPDEPSDKEFRGDRTMMKVVENARQVTGKEAKVANEEAGYVADFVKEFGISPKSTEVVRNSTLAMISPRYISLGRAGEFGDGENRFVILRPNLLKGGLKGRQVLDHEYLHMYQSPDCPKPLVEGVTALYTADMQPTTGRRMYDGYRSIFSPYLPDRMASGLYQRIVGKEALGDAYFRGDMTKFMENYEKRVGSTKSLERQLKIIQTSRDLLKNQKNIVVANIVALGSISMGMAALSMAGIDYLRARFRG